MQCLVLCLLQLPPGGILADAMGLGKTVQAMLLMAGTAPHTAAGPKAGAHAAFRAAAQRLQLWLGGSLVLVPKILLGQWVDELLLKCGADPRMVVCEFTGGQGARSHLALAAQGPGQPKGWRAKLDVR
jgi:hypothetical protein